MKTASWSDKEKYSLAKRERRKGDRKHILGCLGISLFRENKNKLHLFRQRNTIYKTDL
jgi:hypothetical protein